MENENKNNELDLDQEQKRWEIVALLSETQKAYFESSKKKDIIIVLLIVLMFLEAAIGYAGFVWYESQFEYAETTTTEVYTEGDNANAEYNENNVTGHQFYDNSVLNENKGVD